MKEFVSRSERDDNEPWPKLDWQNAAEIPMPPVREKLLLRISAPIVPKAQKGNPVSQHSDFYLLAEETMSLDGLSLGLRSTIDALRRIYMQWRKNLTYYYNSRNCEWHVRNPMFCSCRELQKIMENKSESGKVDLGGNYRKLLQEILDSEYLDASGEFLLRFDKEMMYLPPERCRAVGRGNAFVGIGGGAEAGGSIVVERHRFARRVSGCFRCRMN